MSSGDCPSSCTKGASKGWSIGLWAGTALAVVGAGAATIATGGMAAPAMIAGMSGLQGFSSAMSNPSGDNSYPEQACALYNRCQAMEQKFQELSDLMDKLDQSKTIADSDVQTINNMIIAFTDMNDQLALEKQQFITKLSTFAILMIVGTAFLSYYISSKRK